MNSFIAFFGLLFALFLPGFLITLISFREVKVLERLLLSITFSIMIAIAIGIGFGYDKNVKDITGGITPKNVWYSELVITGLLFIVAAIIHRKNISFNNIKALQGKIKIKNKRKPEETIKYKEL